MAESSTQERFKRGAEDAGRFFGYIADFVGFTAEDAAAIRQTRFIIEKHIPTIVGNFYTQLLRFPATRRIFLKPDGQIDQAYLEMRMQHQATFWRRAATGQYDDDFARFVDYVGRAHTSQGADPGIYIPHQYVIGMVGFVQRGVAEALIAELREVDPELERRAASAWTALMMVILEMFSRPYDKTLSHEAGAGLTEVDRAQMLQLSVDTYERSLGMARAIENKVVAVAREDEIPDGQRKIVQVEGLSIGVFHHHGQWIALNNSCLHRGGPVCIGELDGDTLTCPWHGYQYDVNTGQLLLDPNARLSRYEVAVREGQVYLTIPILVRDEPPINLNIGGEIVETSSSEPQPTQTGGALQPNEFKVNELGVDQMKKLAVNGEDVVVCNVAGVFYATQNECTHAGGPLSEGRLDGINIICPWHDSCFDVTNGQVTCKPARKPLKTFKVVVDSDIGRIES